MARSARLFVGTAMLTGALASLVVSCASQPAAEQRAASMDVAPLQKDPGLPGKPEDDRGRTAEYLKTLTWDKTAGHMAEAAVGCHNAAGGTTIIQMRIEPEKRAHQLSKKNDLAKWGTHGRFVAAIINLGTERCEEWKLGPGDSSFVWMSKERQGVWYRPVVRLYWRDASTGEFDWSVRGLLEECTHPAHAAASAKWSPECSQKVGTHDAKPWVTHNELWVSCSGGCCYTRSLEGP